MVIGINVGVVLHWPTQKVRCKKVQVKKFNTEECEMQKKSTCKGKVQKSATWKRVRCQKNQHGRARDGKKSSTWKNVRCKKVGTM